MTTAKLNRRIEKSEDDFSNNRFETTSELLTKFTTLKQLNTEIDIALEDEKQNRIAKAKDLKLKVQKWR